MGRRNYETNEMPDAALVKWNELSDLLTNNNVLLKDFFEHYVSHKYKKDFDKRTKEKLNTYDYILRNNEENKANLLLDDLLLKSKYYILFN